MSKLRLLPGERELVRLRPSPAAWLGRYLLALGFVAWGVFTMTPWGPEIPDTSAVVSLVSILMIPAGPILAGAALYATRRRWVRFWLCAAVGFAVVPLLWLGPDLVDDGIFALLSASSAIALMITEIDRRKRLYHLTNLRIVFLGGLWSSAGWTVHYEGILDLDIRRSPLARMFGYGTIDPVMSHPAQVAPPTKRRKMAVQALEDTSVLPPSIQGVGRLRAVARLLQAFIQDATANEYLRAEQKTQQKVGDALRALGPGNVLPHRH